MDAGGRFTTAATSGIVCAAMNELRELRRAVGLGQREFAALLSIPLETYRPWDSGRRVVFVAVLQRARDAVVHHQRQHELLPLDRLAKEPRLHSLVRGVVFETVLDPPGKMRKRLSEVSQDDRQMRQAIEQATKGEPERMNCRLWRESPRCANQFRVAIVQALFESRPRVKVHRPCPRSHTPNSRREPPDDPTQSPSPQTATLDRSTLSANRVLVETSNCSLILHCPPA
jgi:transcriptional regulator with XRE-family HTH domain